MIDKLTLANSTPLGPQTPTDEAKKPSFASQTREVPNDEFVVPGKKKKSKAELALVAITGASVTALAITRAKLGKIIKLVDPEVPKTLFGRIKKLCNIAAKDGMTQLFNKKALMTNIEKEYAQAMKTGNHLSVVMLDMDNFKGINEVFSHDTGDIVLKRIAQNIQSVADKYGIQGARYGGEEFVATLSGHDAKSAQKIAVEIADAIKSDEVIQGYLPEFMQKAQDELNFFEPRIKQLNQIFKKIKHNPGLEENAQRTTNLEVSKFIEEHIQKCKPADTKNLNEILEVLRKEPPAQANLSIKIGKDSTLGNELDKIYQQYKSQTNDLTKWTDHLKSKNVFTVSGGVADLSDAKDIKEGADLIKLADAALKGAKENGKNQILIANDDMIDKIIKNSN